MKIDFAAVEEIVKRHGWELLPGLEEWWFWPRYEKGTRMPERDLLIKKPSDASGKSYVLGIQEKDLEHPEGLKRLDAALPKHQGLLADTAALWKLRPTK